MFNLITEKNKLNKNQNINDKPDSARLVEEEHFHKLFLEVVDYLKDEHKIHDSDIRKAIDRLVLPDRYNQGHPFPDIDLARTDNLCGYLFRHAIHGAGLMRHKTLQAFRGCPDLNRTLRQPALRVFSLEGGPGPVVGFLSALHELGPRGCRLNMTVVSTKCQWEQCFRLVKHFGRVGNFGSVSELIRDNAVDFKFVRSTLPGYPLEDKVRYLELGYADIVVVCEVISELRKRSQLIAYLHYTLNESALILLVDWPFERDMWSGFEVLFLSQKHDTYHLYQEYDSGLHYKGLPPLTTSSRIAVLRKE